MRRYIKPSIIFLLLLCIALACDGNGNNNTTTRTIGPEGGTMRSSDRKLTLEIPAGALDEDTEITIRRLSDDEISEEFGDTEIDCAYELIPEGLNFNMPVRASVRLRDDPNQEDGTLIARAAFLFSESGDVIEFMDNLEVEIDGAESTTIVSADLNHFSDLVTTTVDGVTATLDMTKEENIPNIFQGTLTVESSSAIDDITGSIPFNSSGALLGEPEFDRVSLPLSGGKATGMITSQCLQEKEEKDYAFQVILEQVDIVSLFSFDVISPQSNIGTDEEDADVVGLVGLRLALESEIVCRDTNSEEDDNPPPPPPTPMPTPPPASNCADFSGVYNLVCDLDIDPLVIFPNFGDPYIVSVEINIDPVTGEVTVEAAQGETTPFIPLEGAADFITNFGFDPQFVELRGPEGSGCEFDATGSAFINGGDLLGEAEDWGLAFDAIGNQLLLPGAVLNINFEIFPAPNLSTVYICEGQGAGQ